MCSGDRPWAGLLYKVSGGREGAGLLQDRRMRSCAAPAPDPVLGAASLHSARFRHLESRCLVGCFCARPAAEVSDGAVLRWEP